MPSDQQCIAGMTLQCLSDDGCVWMIEGTELQLWRPLDWTPDYVTRATSWKVGVVDEPVDEAEAERWQQWLSNELTSRRFTSLEAVVSAVAAEIDASNS